jgi:transposase InsO family protein
LPPVRGFGYICNIVDCYSRFAFGGPLKGKHTKDVADLLLKFIYLIGSPRILQNDNGKEFTNSLSQVVEDLKTKQIHGRPYHPQSQGRVERFNKTLTEYFRREMSLEKNWPSKLQKFYYNYNSVHKSTRQLTNCSLKDLILLHLFFSI